MRCVAQSSSRRVILARTDLPQLRALNLDIDSIVDVPTVTAATGWTRKRMESLIPGPRSGGSRFEFSRESRDIR